MSKIIGIDLGTTNSAVAVMEGGKAKIIPAAEGGNLIPSIVNPKEDLVGTVAKRQMVLKPEETVYAIKRLMACRFDSDVVEKMKKKFSFEIVEGKDGLAAVKVGDKTYTPQEISAKILQKAKKDAQDYLGEEVKEAVITVHAYFDDSQRQATKQSGQIAGFKVRRIINEPTAASLSYGLDKKEDETIAVFDLGGGTFDISILELGDGVFEVKSTNGDTFLGGEDFDTKIIDYVLKEFKAEHGIDLSKDKQALQRIKDASEKAKIELSTKTETEISQPFITQGKDGNPVHLSVKLTRAKLEELVADLIKKVIPPCKQALEDAELEKNDIDEVILVGGMTRMPKIRQVVEDFFGKKPSQSVNPDEAVALGAAIQGAVLSGEVKDVLLLDVTPLTLGIETLGGVMTPLIEKNTTIPTSKSQTFSTAADNQTQVEVHVLQGERPMAKDNKSLGRFILDGIPPSPRGVPQIEVTFDIDADGILNVSAKDKATGKEQKITIKNATNLSEDEVEKMKNEAEKHAEEDEKKRKLVDKKNEAESIVLTTEKTLKNASDKVSSEEKKEIENALKSLKETKDKDDVSLEELDKKISETSQVLQKFGQKLYQAAQESEEKDKKSDQSDKKKKGSDESDEGEVQEGEVVEE